MGRKNTPEEKESKLEQQQKMRQKLFRELCTHISNGFSLESFPDLSPNSIQKYLEMYPKEFIQEELDQALRKGRKFWEGVGIRQANGECLGDSSSWFNTMVNRYGWKRPENMVSNIT